MKIKILKNLKNNQGFTIAEMVVVIFIISVSLIGILSLISQNIRAEYVNKNMVIASQLAQEGLELVRNIRDDNFINGGGDWKHGAGGALSKDDIVQDNVYTIDYVNGINNNVDSINDANAKLYLDNNSFYENSSSANPTIFSRVITVDNETADSITLTCVVQWQDHSSPRQYSVQMVLYNWR